MAARGAPTSSITARTSSIRCSSDGAPDILSERPCPRLSNVTTRANFASRRNVAEYPGSSWNISMLDVSPGTRMMSRGPSPIT